MVDPHAAGGSIIDLLKNNEEQKLTKDTMENTGSQSRAKNTGIRNKASRVSMQEATGLKGRNQPRA